MHKFTCLILLLLATGLSAQTQRPNTFLQTGPDPVDPTQLGDFEPPVITCLNGLSVNIMPTGLLTIWANDLIEYIDDNATPSNLITVGIRKAGTGVGFPADSLGNTLAFVQFYCADVGHAIPLEIWAKDGSGNLAFCTTSLSIYDISGGCNGGNTVNVHMCAKVLCSGEMMEEVIFYIDGSVNFAPPFSYFDLSNQSGCSEINNNVPVASTFSVVPEKDDNPLNGSVDAQDFEILSKHLNGTEPFTEPWQWVAADANRDGLITLEDSMEFRNLALGIYLELPYNTSWRFVPEGYQFPSPNPLSQPFPESLLLEDVFSNMDSIFLGIKIGDLNCSASPNLTTNPTENRNIKSTAKRDTPTDDPTQLGDFEPPVLICLNGLSVNIMPTGLIQLWQTDYLSAVSDNATPVNQIKLAVQKAGAGTEFPTDVLGNPLINTLFTCNELGTQGVELWAKDLAGNTTKCLTNVIIQDNLGNCGGAQADWLIKICAQSALLDGIEELSYDIAGENPNGPFVVQDLSNQIGDGCGYFEVPLGSNVVVAPKKDDNPLNGVTTYDIVLITRHYHGIELLDSPYKLIAADANRDGLVNELDSAEIRHLILGMTTEFPNNNSWRFVDKNYVFPDPSNPFAATFPESLTIQNIQSPVTADFIGIKIGDVNNTAVHNFAGQEIDERGFESEMLWVGTPNPNPTSAGAGLPIYLPAAENLYLEIADLTGKILWSNTLQREKGSHLLEIPAQAMPSSGLYLWRLRAGGEFRAGKLLRW